MTATLPLQCCPKCDNGEGKCFYPYYGVAPHTCFHKIPGAQIGQSRELPEEEWPENFEPDEKGKDGYPGTGTYTHCLACGRPGELIQKGTP